jgi:hypothetical protein
MSNKNLNKIVYPFLIIVFSILFIFGLLRMRKTNILENNLEKYINYASTLNSKYTEHFNSKFTEHFIDETINESADISNDYIKKVLNGNWTTLNSVCDSSGKVSKMMNIQLNNLSTNNISDTEPDDTDSLNLGTIQTDEAEYNIRYASITNLTGKAKNQNLSISILFNNKIGKTASADVPLKDPNTFNGVMSIYIDNTLIYKFSIYKVNDDQTAPDDLCRIIQSRNILIDQPPPIYDFKTYNIILNNYKFPSNYLSIVDLTINTDILNVIQRKYAGKIQFAIQRVFYSPASQNKEIISYLSEPIVLNCIDGNQIPNTLTVSPFELDRDINELDSFFTPKATILYFFKFKSTDVTYGYKDQNLIEKPRSTMSFTNGANDLMKNTIKFNNLSTVELINTNNYEVTYITRSNSDYETSTIFNFADIYPLL